MNVRTTAIIGGVSGGLELLAERRDGVVQQATAAATATALAAGVIFSQYLSHPVLRDAQPSEEVPL